MPDTQTPLEQKAKTTANCQQELAINKRSRIKAAVLRITTTIYMLLAGQDAAASCNTNLTERSHNAQYLIAEDNTVTDINTNLSWMRCPVGYTWQSDNCMEDTEKQQLFNWQEALTYAQTYQQNTPGWRLPNTKELESLVKRNCYNPSIEESVFSNMTLNNFWSSTNTEGGAAWAVNFNEGGVIRLSQQNSYMIRLVKTEQ